MDLSVRDIPEELLPHIAAIKKIAHRYGINEISLLGFVPSDLPYETARVKLLYDLPFDIDENAFTDEVTAQIGIATYLINLTRIDERFRSLAAKDFFPL